MNSLGTQFEQYLTQRLSQKVLDTIATEASDEMIEFIRESTRKGEGVPNGQYDNYYHSQKYRNTHKNGRTQPVDLRQTGDSMRNLRSTRGTGRSARSGSARLEGSEKLQVWNTHKKYRRQILPERADQVPSGIRVSVKNNVLKALNDGKQTSPFIANERP